MRKIAWCAVATAMIASAAQAAIVINLAPTNAAPVDATGGRREIAVTLVNTNAANDGLGGFQTDYTADKVGLSAVGAIGGAGSAGTGSRYNSPDWDSNTVTGLAINPPAGAVPVTPATLGLYGTVIVAGNPNAASSLVGYIVVDIAPSATPRTLTISAANFQAFGLFGDNLDAAIGTGATFTQIPEPASALLLVAALPFLRRRSA